MPPPPPQLPYRVLVGGLFHESHSFLQGHTAWDDFHVLEGNALFSAAGAPSPLGGVIDFARANSWEILPTLHAYASPGPVVAGSAFEEFWRRFHSSAQEHLRQGTDAIFLVLHGAMVSENYLDIEGEFLDRIRNLPGAERLPLFGVYDLHANFSPAMARAANGLLAYRENPHTDARQAAIRACGLLRRALQQGQLPHQVLIHPPIVWPATGTGTAAEPMRGLLDLARELEVAYPELWAVNINGGFAYADTPDTGMSISAITTLPPAQAQELLHALQTQAQKHAAAGIASYVQASELLPELKRLCAEGGLPGLTVLVEPSDNIGGGAPGSSVALLQAALENGLENVGICLWDPENVRLLDGLKPGDAVQLMLGPRGNSQGWPTVSVRCEYLSSSDGRFALEDPRSHLASMCGAVFDMGRCAVVRTGGATILLTTHRTPPMDLGQWRSQQLDPQSFSFLVVKAAVAHRQAYDPIAARQFWIETPGPCTSDLRSLTYTQIRRPIFPLDPEQEAFNSLALP